MVQSQFKTFGFWLTILMTFSMMLLFFWFLFETFFIAINGPGIARLTLVTIGMLLGSLQIWRDSSVITIDTVSMTITFTNFFTKKKKNYNFDDFDGFIEMDQFLKSGTYKIIFLVQKNKLKKISSFYYSNLEELREALTGMTYLGRKD